MIKKQISVLLLLLSTWAFAKPMYFYIPSHQKHFYFELEANPTTGFQWKLKQYDKTSLMFVKSQYIQSTPKLIGRGGKMRFYFDTLNSNIDSVVYLEYGRPWEKSPAFKREVHIKSK